MKRLASNGLIQLVHEGVIYRSEKGAIEVPDHVEGVARNHGCTDWVDPKAGEKIKIVEKIVEVPVEKIVEKRVEVEKPDDTDPNSKGSSDNVDEMKRGELTASLTALGVAYKMPITNEDLRALLRGELKRRFEPKQATEQQQAGEQQGSQPGADEPK